MTTQTREPGPLDTDPVPQMSTATDGTDSNRLFGSPLDIALLAAREGLSVVPPMEDGTKAPLGSWKKYQATRADETQIRKWYQNGRTGVGLVCGEVSGGLEMFEFEGRAVRDGIQDRFKVLAEEAGLGDVLTRIRNGYVERTPSGGIHVLWRCAEVEGNLKLARRVNDDGEIEVLIETRGEGGFTIIAPSSGPVHETGEPYVMVRGGLSTIPTITPDERRDIINIARSLDEIPEEPKDSYKWKQATGGEGRPGDNYNDRTTGADMVALLERHGWERVHQFGDRTQMRRPGKSIGISATVFDSGAFVCFTTSTRFDGYDQKTKAGVYSPFSVYAILEHNGDYSAAAKALTPPNDFTRSKTAAEEATGPLPFLSLADLCAKVDAAGPRKYLIRGIWPSGAYGVHAAEMKAQKTWNAVDLAVSVASGTPWLGTYAIDDPGPVVMFMGEGGEGSIVRRIRAICDSRGLRAENLPITVCVRAPHLGKDGHMEIFAEQVQRIRPKLVTLDPLYLSAAGAKGSDLYGMGELLERPQLICDSVDASFMVVTHFNRGNRTGAGRITGAGPAEWGRVLIGVDVKSRHTDPNTKASTVVSVVDVIGGEVPDHEFRLKRIIVAVDPASLDSPLRYVVEVIDDDSADAYSNMPPARRKLLEAVAAVGTPDGATGSQLVDWIAAKYGHGLTRPTVSTELNAAHKDGLVDSVEKPGGPTLWFPSGGVGGVVTTPSRHQATGDSGGVSSVSSLLDDTRHPTPKNDTPEVSPLCPTPDLCADYPFGHLPLCPVNTVKVF